MLFPFESLECGCVPTKGCPHDKLFVTILGRVSSELQLATLHMHYHSQLLKELFMP